MSDDEDSPEPPKSIHQDRSSDLAAGKCQTRKGRRIVLPPDIECKYRLKYRLLKAYSQDQKNQMGSLLELLKLRQKAEMLTKPSSSTPCSKQGPHEPPQCAHEGTKL
ncbi:hypothetical protein [Circoviridae sp.]|nr:hypothetical protein [Circoviridae sp.]